MAGLLVTGGAGFIGANFVHQHLRGHPGELLVVLDALTYAGNPQNLRAAHGQPGFMFVQGDIRDTTLVERLLREGSIDTIVHFAAESHVDRSITGPDAFVETNIVGTHSLLKAARRVWLEERNVPVHRFHHVSTDEVYGSLEASDPPFVETTRYAPNSPYSATKAGSDHLVRAYCRTYGLTVTISNCSNNFGPFQFPEKLIPLTIVNILEGRALPVYGDGRNVRDWLHVSDHCRGIEVILSRGRSGETYNIGGGSELQNIDLVRKLCAIADRAFERQEALKSRFPRSLASTAEGCAGSIQFVEDRPGHDRRYAVDARKMRDEFGFSCRGALDELLEATFYWYVDNEAWWRGILDGSYRTERIATAYRAPLPPT